MSLTSTQYKKVFIIAGETSGDHLGASLMKAVHDLHSSIEFIGVGGVEMQSLKGFNSLFPLSDIAVMGFLPVILKLPTLVQRINQTVKAVIVSRPDLLIIVDSPDFTHRVAKKLRKSLPHIPILNYVSPTVWAWREGRAKKMRPYVDHLLALLPFEPAVHLRLKGPECTYVGHPLIERLSEFQPNNSEIKIRERDPPQILILPGSRHAEVDRLMPIFGEAVALIAAKKPNTVFVLPAVAHLKNDIIKLVEDWKIKPEIIYGQTAKLAAFRTARAAIAASGTVTLELALGKIPMITAYKVSILEEMIIKTLVKVQSAILPNLIINRQFIPEFLQKKCTAENISSSLLNILPDGKERRSQLDGFDEVLKIMQVNGGHPSVNAAKIALSMLKI